MFYPVFKPLCRTVCFYRRGTFKTCKWMPTEWMMHLYSALLCIAVHPKRFTIMWGGGGLSSTTTSVQHPLGWCDGCHRTTAPVPLPHTSYRWRGERVIEPIKWMGIIRRPWLRRASGGNLARTPGLHPYSLREVPWNFFYDHRESGPRFNVSSERLLFDSLVSPSLYSGVRNHTLLWFANSFAY